jgi:hypothetical protein
LPFWSNALRWFALTDFTKLNPARAALGVTGFDCADDALSLPSASTAATVNSYVLPLMRPITVCVVAVELNRMGAFATEPTHGVTMYPATGTGPAGGACHETVVIPLPATAVPISGGVAATQPLNTNIPPTRRAEAASDPARVRPPPLPSIRLVTVRAPATASRDLNEGT